MVINAHSGGVREIDYSPDGKRLVSVGKDRMIKIWDAHTGQLLNSTRATNVEITHVAYSPDGEFIATSDHDLSAKIWDSQTLAQITTLEGHETGVLTLAFSPDSDRLVTSSLSPWEPEFVWDTSAGQIVGTLFGDAQVWEGISFSPDGNWIAAASADGTVRLWNATTYEEVQRFGSGESYMLGLAFSPDNSRLAVSSSLDFGQAGMVTIWDIASREEYLTFYAHADMVFDIEFSPDGNRLATSSLDGTAKVWEASTGRELLQLSGHKDGILSVAFDPSGERLATGSKDGTLRLWNVSLNREYLSFPTCGSTGGVAFSPDGTRLAAGIGCQVEQGETELQDEVYLWNLLTQGEPVRFTGGFHPGGISAITFNPDGSRLASTGIDGHLNIWEVETGQLINAKEELSLNPINDVAFSPDGSMLAIGGESYSFFIFDSTTLQKFSEFPNRDMVDGLAFSPDGTMIASTTRSGVARLWDVRTEEEFQTIVVPADRLEDIVFSPDGRNLAIAGDDDTVSILQLGDDQARLTLYGHSASVTGVDSGPDGRRIASVSQDGTARIWDAVTGEELLLLKTAGGAGMVGVAFSPDGKMLATIADDAVRVFLLEIEDLIELAESRLSRGFTQQECLRFLPASRCKDLVTPDSNAQSTSAIEKTGKICAFTDSTGIMIYGYYYQTYLGVKEAAELHNWDMNVFIPEAYEAGSQDFDRTLNAGCNLIVGMGFTIYDVVKVNASQHLEQRFLLVDDAIEPPYQNVWTVTYASDQGAFLGGYLAAAMTQTGVIGTFGGAKVPTVMDFMDGFESGMRYYNQKYGTEVRLLGWDSSTHEGYIAAFIDEGLGYDVTQKLLNQDADIIFPVAGSVTGFGALQAVAENGESYLIGVDQDYVELFPQFTEFVLTSVIKRFDISVIRAADALVDGNFVGGNHPGTLQSGEVALAPFHAMDEIIPDHIKADLEQLEADIIAGKIHTKPDKP
jgi:WD40 repeat protein